MKKRHPNVIVSQSLRAEKPRISPRILITLFAALAVLVGIGGLLAVRHFNVSDANRAGGGAGGAASSASQGTVDEQVDRANANADYAASVKLLEASKAQSNEDKLKLALAYSNNAQYKESLAIFDELDAKGELNASYASAAAETAVSGGDKQAAIRYFETAKRKTLEEKLVTADSQIEVYDFKIQQLKAGEL